MFVYLFVLCLVVSYLFFVRPHQYNCDCKLLKKKNALRCVLFSSFVWLACLFAAVVVVVVHFSRLITKILPKACRDVCIGLSCNNFPYLFPWQRLIKMNMPIMGDNTVLFTSTLFALIRTALGIFSTGDPAYADSELRRTIKILWPKTSKKILEKMIPLQSG